MQLKVTRSGPRTYLQIVHAYRDPGTGRPEQRHIANLGRADQLDESDLDTLINGLLKFTNRTKLDELHSDISSEGTTFYPALQVGDIWAILGIWHQLKLALDKVIEGAVKRGVVEFEATDSHDLKIQYAYRLLIHDKAISPLPKGQETMPKIRHRLAMWMTHHLPEGHELLT